MIRINATFAQSQCASCGYDLYVCDDCQTEICMKCDKILFPDCGGIYCSDKCMISSGHRHEQCPVYPRYYHCGDSLPITLVKYISCQKDSCLHCDNMQFIKNNTTKVGYMCGSCLNKIEREQFFSEDIGLPKQQIICECGQDAVNPKSSARQHSSWCPKSKI